MMKTTTEQPQYNGVCPCCQIQHEGPVLQMIGKDSEFAKWKTAMSEHAALIAVAEAAKALITPHKGGRFAGELKREQDALSSTIKHLAAVRSVRP